MSDFESLLRFLDDHALPCDAAVLDGFARYLALLERAGRKMNLVGPLSRQALVEQLLCDSLVPLTLGVALPDPLLDVGSGAGLPGVPLKIVRRDLEVVLVEPRERRYRFLGMVQRELGLEGLQRVHGRIDRAGDLDALGLARPGTALAKAVLPVGDWLRLAATLVRPDDGRLVAMCSAQDWASHGAPTAAELGLTVLAEREVRWRDAAPRVCAVLG